MSKADPHRRMKVVLSAITMSNGWEMGTTKEFTVLTVPRVSKSRTVHPQCICIVHTVAIIPHIPLVRRIDRKGERTAAKAKVSSGK